MENSSMSAKMKFIERIFSEGIRCHQMLSLKRQIFRILYYFGFKTPKILKMPQI